MTFAIKRRTSEKNTLYRALAGGGWCRCQGVLLVNQKGASTHVHTLWPKLEDHSSQPFFAASTEPCYTFLRYGLGVLLSVVFKALYAAVLL